MCPSKKEKGTYVKRSTYQKVVEENKKLLCHIKILIGDPTPDKLKLTIVWKEKFKKDKDLNDFIKDLIFGNIPKKEK